MCVFCVKRVTGERDAARRKAIEDVLSHLQHDLDVAMDERRLHEEGTDEDYAARAVYEAVSGCMLAVHNLRDATPPPPAAPTDREETK